MSSSYPPRADLVLQGFISAAVHDPALGGSVARVTQNVYAAYNDYYLSRGLEPPRIAFGGINRELGIAFAQRRAEQSYARSLAEFKRTGFDQALTPEHQARAFYHREGAAAGPTSNWHVRYGVRTGSEEFAVETFYTYEPDLPNPATVADLEQQLDEDAAAHTENYGEFLLERTGFVSIQYY